MTEEIPDPLLRFVPTPYGCILPHNDGETRIESNSERLVDDVLKRSIPPLQTVLHFRVIVDDSVEEDGEALTYVHSVHIQTLLRGTTTMLIFDRESRELLAFLSPNISSEELFTRLLPAVLIPAPATELQTRDIGSIAL